MQAVVREYNLSWQPEAIVSKTTRWTEDPTGKTVELRNVVGYVCR